MEGLIIISGMSLIWAGISVILAGQLYIVAKIAKAGYVRGGYGSISSVLVHYMLLDDVPYPWATNAIKVGVTLMFAGVVVLSFLVRLGYGHSLYPFEYTGVDAIEDLLKYC